MRKNFHGESLDGWAAAGPAENVLRRRAAEEGDAKPPRASFGTELHEDVGAGIRIEFVGDLDLATASAAQEWLRRTEGERRTVLVDLRRLRFIDSTGLSVILAAERRIGEAGGRLVVVRGPRAVQRVFEITRIDERLEMVDEPPTAPIAPV